MVSVLTRIGAVNNTTGTFADDNALFLKVFSGEVLAAFDEQHLMKPYFRERNISSGKTAQFVYSGKATSKYFQPGDVTNDGQNEIPMAEKVITIDDLVVSAVQVYDLDEMKSHYEVRSEYAKQLGQALARRMDSNIAQLAILAARSTNEVTSLPGGSVINAGATVATDGTVLANAIFEAAEILDNKDIPEDGRTCFLRPTQYYNLVRNLDQINSDWGGQGSYADGSVLKIAGIDIVKYNRLPSTLVTANAGENNTYNGDFTGTFGVVTHRDAVGTVKLKDLKMEQSGSDFHIVHQSTLFVGSYACGHGILRPECSVEISNAV